MDATLIQTYESGECSIGDISSKCGVTAPTIYAQMRRLGLPLLGKPGCKLRDYRSYGPRYNEVRFSKRQAALVVRRNADNWHDSEIARTLQMPENPVRKLRIKLGLPARVRKPLQVGTRYGNLIVVRPLSPKRKHGTDPTRGLSSRSLCRCDCGGKRIAFNEDLRSGNTKTCGCRIHLRNPDSEWIRVFHGYLSGASARRVRMALSLEHLKQICSLPCYYCGAKESNLASPPRRGHRSRTSLNYNGIDQVNPGDGYRLGNVLPCCHFCNRAKANLILKDFVPWVNRILNRRLTISSVTRAAFSLGKRLRTAQHKW